jgi:2-hydroxychromene-2-carboxylate isomerase
MTNVHSIVEREHAMPQTARAPISFYFDFISPYGYFASTQIEALAARYGRTVDWRPVLIGITVLKIMGLKPLMDTPLKSEYIAHDKPRMAKLLGVPFKEHGLRGHNSVAASRAFLWLKTQDPALAVRFAHRMYARLWVRGEDFTSAQAVAEEAQALGVDSDKLRAAIETTEMKNALKDAVDQAVALGVFGVPFFIVDGEPIWGVDRLWMLEQWLRDGSWTGR